MVCQAKKLVPQSWTTEFRLPIAAYTTFDADAARCVKRVLDANDEFERSFADRALNIDGTHPSHLVQLTRLANHFSEKRDFLHKEPIKVQRQARTDDFAGHKHHKKAYSKIASSNAKPIIFLRRPEEGPRGQAKSTFAISPKELDTILSEAWQVI